jgi:hypothetical protein
MQRCAALICGVLMAGGATACAHHTSSLTLSSRGASALAQTTSSTSAAQAATSTTSTDSSTTSTSAATTSSPVTTTTLDPLTAATPAITTALEAYGHNPAYAACVITQLGQQFTGTRLAFAIAVLSLKNATDQQLTTAVASSGISDTDKQDMPDALHAIADTCASTEHPGG